MNAAEVVDQRVARWPGECPKFGDVADYPVDVGVCFRCPFPGLPDRALLEVDSSDLPALLGEVDRVSAFPTSDIECSAAGARRIAGEHPVQELRPGRVIPRSEAEAVQQPIWRHAIHLDPPNSCRQRTEAS